MIRHKKGRYRVVCDSCRRWGPSGLSEGEAVMLALAQGFILVGWFFEGSSGEYDLCKACGKAFGVDFG
jgi:hypothetical protein